VFLVGHLGDGGGRQIFPIGESDEGVTPVSREVGKQEVTSALRARDYKDGTNFLIHNIYGGFGEEQPRVFEETSPTIRTPKGGGHLPLVAQLVGDRDNPSVSVKDEAFCLPSNPMSDRQQAVIFDENIDGKVYRREECPTLRSPNTVWNKKLFDGFRIRRLTPTECERLQGFPDGWTKGLSDTQRYKVLGNAVTVNVVEFLGKKLGGEVKG